MDMITNVDAPTAQIGDAHMEMLLRRARELAQASGEEATQDGDDVLLFRVRDERYAVPLGLLLSVQRPGGLTAVPCAPAHIAGIVNVRGEVATVLNLSAILGLDGEQEASSDRQIILAQLPQGRIGLLVDEVLGMSRITPDALSPSISGRDFILGIHEATTVLLDLALLLTPDRLNVFEHVT